MRHGVLRRRFGQLSRVAGAEPAVHVSAFEAEAWCRWAGRRLPGEVEWEAAAHQGATRGFRFGDVWEWTASTFRPYPGFVLGPWRDYSLPCFGRTRVLRGASFATPLEPAQRPLSPVRRAGSRRRLLRLSQLRGLKGRSAEVRNVTRCVAQRRRCIRETPFSRRGGLSNNASDGLRHFPATARATRRQAWTRPFP